MLGLAMLVPMAFALAANADAAGGYFFGAAVTVFFGTGAFALTSGRRSGTDFRSALLFVLLWWSVAPAFAAVPLMANGAPFEDAYFETVSALTTTGAWLAPDTLLQDRPGMLWRALLQWIGGLASVSIAAAVFIRPELIGADTLLPPFSRGDKNSHLRPLRNAVTAFAGPYLLLTAGAAIMLAIAGASVFDAVILSLSTTASGGMTPTTDGLASYSNGVVAALFPFILFSGANFVLIARLLRGDVKRARDLETGSYVIIVIVVGVLYWLLLGAHGLGDLPAQLFNSVSLLSTNGLLIGDAPTLPVALTTAIIGGAAISTAGGFKIIRWLVIMRRAREEIRKLVTPSGVFGSSRITDELAVWMHFLVFTFTLGALVVAVAAGGHTFDVAVTTATAILSNTGPLLTLAESGVDGYAVFNGPLRFILIFGMILGRLEALAALALINRAFWRS